MEVRDRGGVCNSMQMGSLNGGRVEERGVRYLELVGAEKDGEKEYHPFLSVLEH